MLGFGTPGGLPAGVAFGLGIVLTFGLMGLVFGLAEWMETPSTADRAGTPLTTYRSDRALTVIQTAMPGLPGLAGGLAVEPAFGLRLGLIAGLPGLALGLVGRAEGNRAWLYTEIAACWLALTGRLPWRLMEFLDDAYRLGLLRTVGPAYQFRHAELQDHLAHSHPPLPKPWA